MFLSALFQQLLCFFLHVETSGAFRKPLSQKEELRCFQQMRAGDALAREKLILHNMRLVAHIIKKYYTNQTEQEDLLSIGTVGLMKAVSTFDYEKGARFATYASRCIENEILMYFRSQRKLQGELSLSDSLDAEGDGSALSLMDVVCVDDDMLERLDLRDACGKVRRCVETSLTPREAKIIRLRYGLDDRQPLTQREIATLCGISRSYVSQRR